MTDNQSEGAACIFCACAAALHVQINVSFKYRWLSNLRWIRFPKSHHMVSPKNYGYKSIQRALTQNNNIINVNVKVQDV